MQSPYLIQVLAEAHVDDMRRAAARSGAPRRRRRTSSTIPRLRAWWGGQLHRPGAPATRKATLPGRPSTPVAACTSVGR